MLHKMFTQQSFPDIVLLCEKFIYVLEAKVIFYDLGWYSQKVTNFKQWLILEF